MLINELVKESGIKVHQTFTMVYCSILTKENIASTFFLFKGHTTLMCPKAHTLPGWSDQVSQL